MHNARRALFVLAVTAGLALVVVGLTALVRLFLGHMALSAEVGGGVLAVAGALSTLWARRARRVAPVTVLELDLPAVPKEVPPRGPLPAVEGMPNGRRPMTLSATVEALARAARDPRVKGLVLQPRFAGAPQAVVEELRDAVTAFGQAGKFTVAFCDTFGEGGPANASYYLAAACDEVVVGPTGMVGLVPLWSEPNFYRGLLDRLGVELEVFAREEFKSAVNQLTQTALTGPDREQRQRLVDSLWQQQVDGVAKARKLEPAQLRRLADGAPLTAGESLAAGLVDRVAYADEVLSGAKQRAGSGAKLLYLSEYAKRAGKARQAEKQVPVGVIHAVGEIHRSAAAPFGATGGPVIAADKLTAQVRAAAKDKKVKAFVLRVDSPGGSAVASDTIWRELANLRGTGRPLVVSMGAVAASGGYYLATAADRVVAQPGTLTGSIGVFTAHPVLAGAKEKLSVRPDEVRTGAEPSMFSVNRRYSELQRQRVDAMIDEVYTVFTQRVADGRHLPVEKVREVARGRVWTGADAMAAGLVDELGGLERALALAVELSGAPAGTRARARQFPRRQGAVRLSRRRPQSSDDPVQTTGVARDFPLFGAGAGVVARAAEALRGASLMCHLGCDPKDFWLP